MNVFGASEDKVGKASLRCCKGNLEDVRRLPAKPQRRVLIDTGPPKNCVLNGCEEVWHLMAAGRQLQEPRDISIVGARAKIISERSEIRTA
jgi:hypothetical protein